MARKAKDILLARGYTEEELKDSPLLKDSKFCAAIEAEAEVADEATALAEERKGLIEKDKEWYKNYAVPEVNKARQEAIEAKKEAAGLKAEMEQLQKYGLRKVADQDDDDNPNPKPNPKPNDNLAFDESKFVKAEDFNKIVSQVPVSLTMLQDISNQHYELFGKFIPGGTTKLHQEFVKAQNEEHFQGSLQDFWEKRYKVVDKREEIATKEREKREEAFREEGRRQEREKLGANPNLRSPVISSSPFANKVTVVGDDGKPVKSPMPWERTREQRATERVSKFATKLQQESV